MPAKCTLTFNGLHGIISQKMVLLIITAERISDITSYAVVFPKFLKLVEYPKSSFIL
jgi:hypothetical protein